MTEGKKRELAVITGAARRIGRSVALELAARGYRIGLHYYQSRAEAQKTAAEIERLGTSAVLLQADLREPDQISAMFADIASLPERLTVLVNAAAVMKPADLRDLSIEAWESTLSLNLRAPWLCAKAAAPLMTDKGGVIINVSDSGARKVWSGYPDYIISKSALETLTRLLARSLAPAIRVNGVAPGLILPSAHLAPDDWERLVNRLPLRQSGSPEDVARAVAFLIESMYITGEILVVDGGYQLT